MTTRQAAGQITITDLNDARLCTCFIKSGSSASKFDMTASQNLTPSQSAATYNPNWASKNLYLTAQVFVSGGGGTDIASSSACTGWKWFADGTQITASTTGFTLGTNTLIVKKNLTAAAPQMVITCQFTYTDPDLGAGAEQLVEGRITLTLSTNSEGNPEVQIIQEQGFMFNQNLTTLTAKGWLLRGGEIDTSVDSATWAKLDMTKGTWTDITAGVSPASKVDASGYTTLTVSVDDVLNAQCFRLTIKDGSTTAQAICSFIDGTDPYEFMLRSNTGTQIKNGTGSTTVFAEVYQGGNKITDFTGFTFNWYLYDADGNAQNWPSSTSNLKTTTGTAGATITLDASAIEKKVTIYCEMLK